MTKKYVTLIPFVWKVSFKNRIQKGLLYIPKIYILLTIFWFFFTEIIFPLLITPHLYKKVFSSEIIIESGKIKHPDKETQIYLNYILGLDSLPEDEREKSIWKIIHIVKNYDGEKECNPYKNYSTETLFKVLYDSVVVKKFTTTESERNYIINSYKEAGCPEIRFVLDKKFSEKRPFRESYYAPKNRMYINFFNFTIGYGGHITQENKEEVPKRFESFFAELSHAKAFFKEPKKMTRKAGRSGWRVTTLWILKIFWNGIQGKYEKWLDVYDDIEYKIPGSMEWVAHEIDEKKYTEQYSVILKK